MPARPPPGSLVPSPARPRRDVPSCRWDTKAEGARGRGPRWPLGAQRGAAREPSRRASGSRCPAEARRLRRQERGSCALLADPSAARCAPGAVSGAGAAVLLGRAGAAAVRSARRPPAMTTLLEIKSSVLRQVQACPTFRRRAEGEPAATSADPPEPAAGAWWVLRARACTVARPRGSWESGARRGRRAGSPDVWTRGIPSRRTAGSWSWAGGGCVPGGPGLRPGLSLQEARGRRGVLRAHAPHSEEGGGQTGPAVPRGEDGPELLPGVGLPASPLCSGPPPLKPTPAVPGALPPLDPHPSAPHRSSCAAVRQPLLSPWTPAVA